MDKKYGVYVLNCPCGWKNLSRNPSIEAVCEACLKHPSVHEKQIKWEWTDQVAAEVCNFSEIKSDHVRQWADKHDFVLVKKNKSKFLILKKGSPFSVGYGDGQGRAFWEYEIVKDGTWQECMGYLKTNVKESIPKHLMPNQK